MRGQDAFKRLPKFGIEDGVDYGIEGRVGIPQPREYFEGYVGYAGLAEGRHDVYAEEGHPADEEYAHDDAHGDCGFVVAHVIRRAVVVVEMYVQSFVLLFEASLFRRGCAVWDVYWSGYGAYVFHVFLSVTVQSAIYT